MRKGEAINTQDLDLLETLPAWVALSRQDAALDLGLDVETAVGRADDLLNSLRTAGPISLELNQQNEASDVLYAACLLLSARCESEPQETLRISSELESLLGSCEWREDDLDERGGLRATLSFLCWRSARLASLSREAQRWETHYRDLFRESLRFDVAKESARLRSWSPADVVRMGPEALFQALLVAQDQLETNPELVGQCAQDLYLSLKSHAPRFSVDLHTFLLAEFARLRAGALRGDDAVESERWVKVGERCAREGPDPEPLLARLELTRLMRLYNQSHCGLVIELAPALGAQFAALGMKEDSIKCTLLLAGALKLVGRCEEGLAILAPFKSDQGVRPALLGWILANCGDMHQMCGEYELAVNELAEASRILRETSQLTGLASVTSFVATIYRAHGRYSEAVELVKEARQQYSRLGNSLLAAYSGVVAAEIYLAMGNPRQAEIEVRTALPILQQHNIVADAVAAVNLLREARNRQKTDAKLPERPRPK